MLSYRVLVADDGLHALEVFECHRGEIDLVLSDLVMPERGGIALHRSLVERDPGVKMVLMTGYPLGRDLRQVLSDEGVPWVQKPLDSTTLSQVVRRVLRTDG